ncbi:MAG: outer membrane protein assembly factor BamD, partial [Candidatus Binatus sp.]
VGVASTAPPGGPAPPATPAEIAPTWPAELDQEIADAATSDEPGIKIYREGLDAMKAGKYPLAVARFTKLQHAYPKSPLSEPAEYFAANALFETGSYDQAILQFNDLVMRFPKGKYASAALLREAQAFVKLNDRIDARLTLQKLTADHAGTPQAAAADTMMKDLASD